jgi:hypothetical protein
MAHVRQSHARTNSLSKQAKTSTVPFLPLTTNLPQLNIQYYMYVYQVLTLSRGNKPHRTTTMPPPDTVVTDSSPPHLTSPRTTPRLPFPDRWTTARRMRSHHGLWASVSQAILSCGPGHQQSGYAMPLTHRHNLQYGPLASSVCSMASIAQAP